MKEVQTAPSNERLEDVPDSLRTDEPSLTRASRWWRYVVRQEGMVIVLLLLMAAMAIISPRFLMVRNLTNVALQSSVLSIVAMGMTFVLISGGIDLSVGSVVGLSAVLLAGLVQYSGWSELLSLGVAIAVGLVFGLFNGFVVTRFRVDAIVVTLGTWYIGRGLVQVYVGNKAPTAPPIAQFLGAGKILGLPVPVLVAIVMALVSHFLLAHTVLGRRCFAIGGNETAARLSGVNVERYRLIFFIMSGLYASIAAVVMLGRLFAVEAGAGGGLEFAAPAAAIVGGTSLYGGRGSIANAVVGALILGVIANGLNLTRTSFFWQQVAVGAVIILAVSVDSLRRRGVSPA
jgi:ribose transport system permease protein